MSKPLPLDERIKAVLTKTCRSEAAADVMASALENLRTLEAEADAQDLASLNPLVTNGEAQEIRTRARDLRFEADRMEASESALRARVEELETAERRARENADRAQVLGVRDALAADIARDYPRIVAELTLLAKRIRENDAECARVGVAQGAEELGRGYVGAYANNRPIRRIWDILIDLPDGTDCAWRYGGEYGGTPMYLGAAFAPEAAKRG